ncbi:hypothetical protein Tco_0038869 [Tanacetum coccineum]
MSSLTVTYTSVYSDSEPWRFQWVSDAEPLSLKTAPQAPPSPNYVGIHCISKFPSIYIQLFWNTLTHDAKTGRTLLHDNIIPKPDLALELGKSISLTEAEEEAVAREVHATHARIVSESEPEPTQRRQSAHEALAGPDPEPMKEDQTGSDSGKLHVSLAGPNPEHMDDEFLATAYPKVHENLKLITDERVIDDNPESHSGSMSSMKNLEDTDNFGDQFLYDKPTEDDQEKSKVVDESDSTIPDPSHQTVTSTPPEQKLDDALLRILERHTADLIEKYSVLPGPESIKNQESKKSLKEIIIIKREQGEKKQESTYTIRLTDKVALEGFDLKSALFKHMQKNRTANRNPANYHLYHALIGSVSQQKENTHSGASVSGSTLSPKDFDAKFERNHRILDCICSKQHPNSYHKLLQITDTRDAVMVSSMHRSEPESGHSEYSSKDVSKQDEGHVSDMEDTDNAHIPKRTTGQMHTPQRIKFPRRTSFKGSDYDIAFPSSNGSQINMNRRSSAKCYFGR